MGHTQTLVQHHETALGIGNLTCPTILNESQYMSNDVLQISVLSKYLRGK
jgi:hypothetical protein